MLNKLNCSLCSYKAVNLKGKGKNQGDCINDLLLFVPRTVNILPSTGSNF